MNLPVNIKPYYYDPDYEIAIFHGDCRDILPHLPKVDLVLTSPPYDDLRDYGGHKFDYKSTIPVIISNIGIGGTCVWVVGDSVVSGSETGNSFRQALCFIDAGMRLHDTMIYWKNGFAFPESNRYAQNFEYMFVFSNGRPKTAVIARVSTNQENRVKTKSSCYRTKGGSTFPMKYEIGKDSRNRENIWIYEVGYMKSTKDVCAYDQPAIFPEALAFDHINSWSIPSDIVLDPMMGSGTTIKMAKQLGRKAIGIEIEEKYCEIAVKRLAQDVLRFE